MAELSQEWYASVYCTIQSLVVPPDHTYTYQKTALLH